MPSCFVPVSFLLSLLSGSELPALVGAGLAVVERVETWPIQGGASLADPIAGVEMKRDEKKKKKGLCRLSAGSGNSGNFLLHVVKVLQWWASPLVTISLVSDRPRFLWLSY